MAPPRSRITPGWLRSEMMLEAFGVTEENWRDATAKVPHFVISETPRFVGRAVAALAADPDRARWNGQSLSSGGLAQVYGFTDLDGSRPDAWRYMRGSAGRRASRPTPPAIASVGTLHFFAMSNWPSGDRGKTVTMASAVSAGASRQTTGILLMIAAMLADPASSTGWRNI